MGRIDHRTTHGVGLRPLALARELVDRVELPRMVYSASGPSPLHEVAALPCPGDILTDCRTAGDHRPLDSSGRADPQNRTLHERGLILDIGHGTGSFSYAVAEAMLAQGVVPDVISSDIHQLSA